MKKEVEFKKEDYEKLLNIFNQDYMQLVKWLIEEYPLVWKEYEDEKMGGKRLMMLKELDKFVEHSKEVHKLEKH